MADSSHLNQQQFSPLFEAHDPRRWGISPPDGSDPLNEAEAVEDRGYRRLNLRSTKFVANEPKFDSRHIEHLIEHPRAKGSGDGAKMAVEYEGRHYLYDGNHRTAAALARGQQFGYYQLYHASPGSNTP